MKRGPVAQLAAALLAGPPGRPWPSSEARLFLARTPAGRAVRLLWPGTRVPPRLLASADALSAAQQPWLRSREACGRRATAALRGGDILLLLSAVSLAERLAARCFPAERRQALEGFFVEAGAAISGSLRRPGVAKEVSPEGWALRAAFFFRALELGLGEGGARACREAALAVGAGWSARRSRAESALLLPRGFLGSTLREVYGDKS